MVAPVAAGQTDQPETITRNVVTCPSRLSYSEELVAYHSFHFAGGGAERKKSIDWRTCFTPSSAFDISWPSPL
jgi:hypothetical protein